jgi:hypothetical protein
LCGSNIKLKIERNNKDIKAGPELSVIIMCGSALAGIFVGITTSK